MEQFFFVIIAFLLPPTSCGSFLSDNYVYNLQLACIFNLHFVSTTNLYPRRNMKLVYHFNKPSH